MTSRSPIGAAASSVAVSAVVILVATLANVAGCGGAQAGEAKTVGHLRDHCSKAERVLKRRGNLDETYAAGECLGRIRGFAAGLHASAGKDASLCPPADLSATQGLAIFMKWANANPQRWDKPWARGVATAWANAFPCAPEKR